MSTWLIHLVCGTLLQWCWEMNILHIVLRTEMFICLPPEHCALFLTPSRLPACLSLSLSIFDTSLPQWILFRVVRDLVFWVILLHLVLFLFLSVLHSILEMMGSYLCYTTNIEVLGCPLSPKTLLFD